jgi:hypothetical protein
MAALSCIGTVETLDCSASAAVEDHDWESPRHDLEIFHEGLALEVLEVVLDLGPNVVHAGVVRPVDLRPSGDPRASLLAQRIVLDVLAQLGEDARALGARADDVHVALDDVEQLGDFVETGLAKEATDGGDARIALRGPYGTSSLLCIHAHGAELIDRERPSTNVRMTAVEEGGGEAAAAVDTDAGLDVENRPPRRQLDRQGDQEENRRSEHQREHSDDDIHRAIDDLRTLPWDDARGLPGFEPRRHQAEKRNAIGNRDFEIRSSRSLPRLWRRHIGEVDDVRRSGPLL